MLLLALAALASATLCLSSDAPTDEWKFLASYPRHLRVLRMSAEDRYDRFTLDGRVDDAVWTELAEWHTTFVDIKRHPKNPALDAVPAYQQASVATLWDEDYLFVAAKLKEPFVWGTVPPEHNGKQVPYHDNDFETFIDVSMSTSFYKEFEMNVLNATYDVNWGVPDGAGLACDKSATHASQILPACVNTSSPFYAGNWSMFDRSKPGGTLSTGGGLATATHTSSFGAVDVNGTWSVEVAFPIRRSRESTHGGLLDTDGILTTGFFNFSRFDPLAGDPLPGMPRFWAADFSRVAHPRKFFYASDKGVMPDGTDEFAWCPYFNCSDEVIAAAVNVTRANPSASDCKALASEQNTILGSDPTYGCYWEWCLQGLGDNQYMHRPLHWANLQFVGNDDDPTSRGEVCGNIEFPARHLLLAVHTAQSNYLSQTGAYARDVSHLLRNASTCAPPACAGPDLAYAVQLGPEVFSFGLHVEESAADLSIECPTRPCFIATLNFTVPSVVGASEKQKVGLGRNHAMTATMTSNQLLQVTHHRGDEIEVPCLFSKTGGSREVWI